MLHHLFRGMIREFKYDLVSCFPLCKHQKSILAYSFLPDYAVYLPMSEFFPVIDLFGPLLNACPCISSCLDLPYLLVFVIFAPLDRKVLIRDLEEYPLIYTTVKRGNTYLCVKFLPINDKSYRLLPVASRCLTGFPVMLYFLYLSCAASIFKQYQAFPSMLPEGPSTGSVSAFPLLS